MSLPRSFTVMPDAPAVRRATLDDAETLVHFNEAMAEETEDKTLDPETVRAGVRAVFDTSGQAFYLVAEREGTIVGSLMITTEWSDWRNADFWWIQSVYVRSSSRRTGVYSALHREVRRRARAADGVCGLRLYVEQDNAAAQAAYETLGMSEPPYQMYEEVL
ncbi:GNAT family N-acetyltransferase [Salinibacter grassmerensis]|uniref:GNAT family N-acetyltransferase n=1 Tax=Salinibacter grassmerensis TaxID=3040353 RepID=UPI0021E75505|nr:GNAT family N-acetyltransferase [Salinibacter grassmerensis]